MSQDNQITLRGYVTAEPKLRQTAQTATPVAEIRVGCTPRRLNRETGEWQDLPTSYYRVKCWRRLAINASSSLHKGDMVVIRGRFTLNEWVDDQQQRRSTLEIEADSVGHDLSYGWSRFLRGSQPQPGQQAALNAGEAARQDLGPSDQDGGDGAFPDDDWDGELGSPGEPGDAERHPAGEELAGLGLRPDGIGQSETGSETGSVPEPVPAAVAV